MATPPHVTLVTEAYNLAEGQSEAAFLRALRAVSAIATGRRDIEVIVLDPSRNGVAQSILAKHFPHFTPLSVPGLSYDGQKNSAAEIARGEFLVFLDGDCAPARNDWLEQLLDPLRSPEVHAVAGLTLYGDVTLTGKAMSILDFGFLFDAPRGTPLGCYASNNVAFRRKTYLQCPAPDEGLLRSYCYKHAQLMMRANTPVISNPNAFVLHELPDVEKERFRRGYDHVAALWADPALSVAGALESSKRFAQEILIQNYHLAIARMLRAPPELGLEPTDHDVLATEFRRLMTIEIQGVIKALTEGTSSGRNIQAREIHQLLNPVAEVPESSRVD